MGGCGITGLTGGGTNAWSGGCCGLFGAMSLTLGTGAYTRGGGWGTRCIGGC